LNHEDFHSAGLNPLTVLQSLPYSDGPILECRFVFPHDGTAMSREITYPWQQTILDAYTAPEDLLPSKIAVAHRAIANRLNHRPGPDVEESIALEDALNALRVLTSCMTPKVVPRPEEKKKKDIA
jgi:hypothetical protein